VTDNANMKTPKETRIIREQDYKPDRQFFFFFQIATNKMQLFLIYLFLQMLYMFQVVSPPIIRST